MIAASQACIKITSWSSTNACYTCTNCGDPFSASAAGVTSPTCGVNSVACAVSSIIFLYFIKNLNVMFFQKQVSPAGIVTKFCASYCNEGTDASSNKIYCCYGNLCNHSSKLSFSAMQKVVISALALMTIAPFLF